jgi:hypothetical protein
MAEYIDTILIERCALYSRNAYTQDIEDCIFIKDKETDCQTFICCEGNDLIITGQ